MNGISLVFKFYFLLFLVQKTTSQQCDLSQIFRTPKDVSKINMDHFELIERGNFDQSERSTTEATANEQSVSSAAEETPKTFANAQVLLRFGGDNIQGQNRVFVPPQCRRLLNKECNFGAAQHPNFYYPPAPNPVDMTHENYQPRVPYYHPYPPPTPFVFPNYYYYCNPPFLPPQLQKYYMVTPNGYMCPKNLETPDVVGGCNGGVHGIDFGQLHPEDKSIIDVVEEDNITPFRNHHHPKIMQATDLTDERIFETNLEDDVNVNIASGGKEYNSEAETLSQKNVEVVKKSKQVAQKQSAKTIKIKENDIKKETEKESTKKFESHVQKIEKEKKAASNKKAIKENNIKTDIVQNSVQKTVQGTQNKLVIISGETSNEDSDVSFEESIQNKSQESSEESPEESFQESSEESPEESSGDSSEGSTQDTSEENPDESSEESSEESPEETSQDSEESFEDSVESPEIGSGEDSPLDKAINVVEKPIVVPEESDESSEEGISIANESHSSVTSENNTETIVEAKASAKSQIKSHTANSDVKKKPSKPCSKKASKALRKPDVRFVIIDAKKLKNKTSKHVEQLLNDALVPYSCKMCSNDKPKMLVSYPITTENEDKSTTPTILQGDSCPMCYRNPDTPFGKRFTNDVDVLGALDTSRIVNDCKCKNCNCINCGCQSDSRTKPSGGKGFQKDIDDLYEIVILSLTPEVPTHTYEEVSLLSVPTAPKELAVEYGNYYSPGSPSEEIRTDSTAYALSAGPSTVEEYYRNMNQMASHPQNQCYRTSHVPSAADYISTQATRNYPDTYVSAKVNTSQYSHTPQLHPDSSIVYVPSSNGYIAVDSSDSFVPSETISATALPQDQYYYSATSQVDQTPISVGDSVSALGYSNSAAYPKTQEIQYVSKYTHVPTTTIQYQEPAPVTEEEVRSVQFNTRNTYKPSVEVLKVVPKFDIIPRPDLQPQPANLIPVKLPENYHQQNVRVSQSISAQDNSNNPSIRPVADVTSKVDVINKDVYNTHYTLPEQPIHLTPNNRLTTFTSDTHIGTSNDNVLVRPRPKTNLPHVSRNGQGSCGRSADFDRGYGNTRASAAVNSNIHVVGTYNPSVETNTDVNVDYETTAPVRPAYPKISNFGKTNTLPNTREVTYKNARPVSSTTSHTQTYVNTRPRPSASAAAFSDVKTYGRDTASAGAYGSVQTNGGDFHIEQDNFVNTRPGPSASAGVFSNVQTNGRDINIEDDSFVNARSYPSANAGAYGNIQTNGRDFRIEEDSYVNARPGPSASAGAFSNVQTDQRGIHIKDSSFVNAIPAASANAGASSNVQTNGRHFQIEENSFVSASPGPRTSAAAFSNVQTDGRDIHIQDDSFVNARPTPSASVGAYGNVQTNGRDFHIEEDSYVKARPGSSASAGTFSNVQTDQRGIHIKDGSFVNAIPSASSSAGASSNVQTNGRDFQIEENSFVNTRPGPRASAAAFSNVQTDGRGIHIKDGSFGKARQCSCSSATAESNIRTGERAIPIDDRNRELSSASASAVTNVQTGGKGIHTEESTYVNTRTVPTHRRPIQVVNARPVPNVSAMAVSNVQSDRVGKNTKVTIDQSVASGVNTAPSGVFLNGGNSRQFVAGNKYCGSCGNPLTFHPHTGAHYCSTCPKETVQLNAF